MIRAEFCAGQFGGSGIYRQLARSAQLRVQHECKDGYNSRVDFFISRVGADAEEALWIAKELRAAGYTTWLQDENFRLNESITENMTVGSECRYTIAVMSPEYFQSKFAQQEWQAAHYKETLIQVMLRKCDRPALIAPFAYICLSGKTEEQKRKLLVDSVRPLICRPQQVAMPKVIKAAHPLIGRDVELRILDRAWSGATTRIVSIVAGGGVGKTSLAVEWWLSNQARDAARVLGWSFYSQGAGEGRQASAETFFDRAFRQWFAEENPPADSWERGERLAELIGSERALLMLDGLEPIQQPDGRFKDPGMTSLLATLSTDANRGMCLCTSRLPLTDLDTYASAEILKMDLENLSETDGAQYLHLLGVPGTDAQLRSASREFGNHALALTLLGHYLVNRGQLGEIPPLFAEAEKGGHARRVMRRYEQVYQGKPELAILRLLGLFDRPADPSAIPVLRKMLLFTMSDAAWESALRNLYDARLIYEIKRDGALDCHPLIREHFADELEQSHADSFKEAHSRLYEHYSGKASYQPDTFLDMVTLFHAVYHGCQAGLHEAVLYGVYRDRILRSEKGFYETFYLVLRLGAYGTDLSLLANFFQTPWTEPLNTLSPVDQCFVLTEAGYALRALGRLEDAVKPVSAAAELARSLSDSLAGAWSFGCLSEIHLGLGNIPEAVVAAEQSIRFADRINRIDRPDQWLQRVGKRTTLADALHQSGDLIESERFFKEAEELQPQDEPEPRHRILYSVRGYQYCDLLLDQGRRDEVAHRASEALDIDKAKKQILGIGLDHLSLGRAYPSGSAEGARHLDQAVNSLRSAGTLLHLPLALLARGKPEDLQEVRRIATRSGMRLHLADYHLISARQALASRDRSKACAHFEKAQALIQETGYHRRESDLQELSAKLG